MILSPVHKKVPCIVAHQIAGCATIEHITDMSLKMSM